ncbi:hypothetical protein [uncultured Jannaschia sp.]|uniref:hypothetical protein n=1 Tax=uncultured Jannaschia sp. TaxID=293347 RepID=UPI00261C287C|nr:hypothetical protein [uncultured Jannaschia sp.]
MTRYRPAYPPEFRRQMVDLVRASRTPEDLSLEFEPSSASIAEWARRAEAAEGKRIGTMTSAEREELNRLRRENRQLRQERDILAKATAWFAAEDAPHWRRRRQLSHRVTCRWDAALTQEEVAANAGWNLAVVFRLESLKGPLSEDHFAAC